MNCFSALPPPPKGAEVEIGEGFSWSRYGVHPHNDDRRPWRWPPLTRTVAAVSFSRQSQQASNLAAAALAEMESLPWTTGSGLPNSGDANYGLTSSDVASDSNLTSDGSGGYCFEGMHVVVQGVAGAGTCSSTWQWANVSSSSSCQDSLMSLPSVIAGTAPLDPHVTCVLINGTTFNIDVYPTQIRSSGAAYLSTSGLSTRSLSVGMAPVVSRSMVRIPGVGHPDRLRCSKRLAYPDLLTMFHSMMVARG